MKATHFYSLRRRFNVLLHRWHRRVGVAASLFLIWMAVSGWLLNHTGGLELSHRYIATDFIAAHYGIRNDIPTRAFVADQHWLAVGGDVAMLDGKKIATAFSQPRGMVAADAMLFVADAAELVILDTNGELIDKISAPFAIERIGAGCGGVVIAGATQQLMTKDGTAFGDCNDAVRWARDEALTVAQRAAVAPVLRTGMTLERILLDLHSGRFFGAWGPYFVDLLALALIALGVSGVWMFVRQRRLLNHQQKHAHQQKSVHQQKHPHQQKHRTRRR